MAKIRKIKKFFISYVAYVKNLKYVYEKIFESFAAEKN